MNAHVRALSVIQDVVEGKVEALSILFELARNNPDALVAACSPKAAWVDEVLTLARAGFNAVPAIKILRSQHLLGLKEGKELYEAIEQHLRLSGDVEACRQMIEQGRKTP